jgi:hypothetical protein
MEMKIATHVQGKISAGVSRVERMIVKIGATTIVGTPEINE